MTEDLDSIKNHYNNIPNKSVAERETTKNINIRKINNFIKTCLISKYVHKNDKVLDIGIGKGGDFNKYKSSEIQELYGIDIANRSILHAIGRYRDGDYRYKAVLKTKNGYSNIINLHKIFDIISIQFSFHYAFSSENTIDIAIENISTHLKFEGLLIITIPCKEEILRRKKVGKLSNSLYSIEFVNPDCEETFGNAYFYSLADSVDRCVEYLVDIESLDCKMAMKGFEMIKNESFNDFLLYETQNFAKKEAFKRQNIILNQDEQEVFSLHNVVVFKKNK